MRVSVNFVNLRDFVNFYHQGLPEFWRNLPMPQTSPSPNKEALIPDESETEAKMVTVVDIPEARLIDFEEVVNFFWEQTTSSDELDVMGI